MDGKFIAYYRVSTEDQGANGNGMAAQRKSSVGSPWRSCARIPALGGSVPWLKANPQQTSAASDGRISSSWACRTASVTSTVSLWTREATLRIWRNELCRLPKIKAEQLSTSQRASTAAMNSRRRIPPSLADQAAPGERTQL
jgi:hypothetical protein